MSESNIACSIRGLSVHFPGVNSPAIKALDDVSLDIGAGEILGIVGESGSGKSMLGLSLLGLVPPPGTVSGMVRIGTTNIVMASRRELHNIRGRQVGLVLQDPTASLNPLRTIASQMREAARKLDLSRASAKQQIVETLEGVGLDPKEVLHRRPFELSGGMNQRIAIAMSLIQQPSILVADEPTTALDAVVQLDVLKLLASLRAERGMTIVLISHDLSVVSGFSDRVAVFYAGKIVEVAPASLVVDHATHPYTKALLAAAPKVSVSASDFAPIEGQFSVRYAGDDGCPFASRCPVSLAECAQVFPGRERVGQGHDVWCWAYSGH